MASFDVYSNYKDNAGVSGVVFGAEKPVLEVEVNEVQEIQKTMLRRAIKNIMGDGITDLSKVVYEDGAVKIKEGCAFSYRWYHGRVYRTFPRLLQVILFISKFGKRPRIMQTLLKKKEISRIVLQ